jgi:hypothetical protein
MALLLAEEGIDFNREVPPFFLFLSISAHLCTFTLSASTGGTAVHASFYRYLSRSALSKSTPTVSLILSLAWSTLSQAIFRRSRKVIAIHFDLLQVIHLSPITCHPVTGNPKHPCVYASWSIDDYSSSYHLYEEGNHINRITPAELVLC